MASAIKAVKRVLLIMYLAVLHGALIYLAVEKLDRDYLRPANLPNISIADPIEAAPVPTPIGEPSLSYDANNAEAKADQTTTSPTIAPASQLLIPVAGVGPEQLIDSFSQARSEGRVHDAIDIPAPAGTPVLAAADGEIIKFFDSEKGGITIYQLSSDKKFVYYYAHLQRRAEDIKEGETVKRGRTIGFVGDTGNAGPGNFHLHFSITAVSDPKRYQEGVSVNPFPLLKYSAWTN
jgi:murein DD-endopeptidase MepM/ murein hydrolase activator NlpD